MARPSHFEWGHNVISSCRRYVGCHGELGCKLGRACERRSERGGCEQRREGFLARADDERRAKRRDGYWEFASIGASGTVMGKQFLCIGDGSEDKYSIFDQLSEL